jgi:hypothetical protein
LPRYSSRSLLHWYHFDPGRGKRVDYDGRRVVARALDREKVVAVEGIITGIGSGYAVGHPDGWTDAVNMLKVSNSQIDQFFH